MIIKPHPLTGEITVISSKSLSHRYVIAAGLSNGISHISNVLESDDLIATKKALEALNVTFDNEKIIGSFPKKRESKIEANESGSTLRFMIPIAMLQNEEIIFTGKGKLSERPLNVFKEMFMPKGYTFEYLEENNLPLKVKGPLKAGSYQMPGNVSSQFLTGLLYALPLVKNDSIIEVTSPLESKGYVDLTLDVLKKFGIDIKVEENKYYIKGNQTYHPQTTSVEGDFSQAAFWLVAGTIGHQITLKGLNKDSLQGDKAIIDFILKMGGNIKVTAESITVYPSKTHGTTIDLGQTPDLGPIIFVLAALSKGTTHIINASRLRIKESDRLKAMYDELTKLGAQIELLEDGMIITGINHFKGNVTLNTHGDHRIAMALSIASIKADGPVEILNPEVVNKSYPTFFDEFEKLKGIIDK